MLENLDRIKQAIEIETKHRFIDIQGREYTFSRFIKSQIKTELKKDKQNPHWQVMFETFDSYPYVGLPERRRAINRLVQIIKLEAKKKNEQEKEIKEHNMQRQKHQS